MLSQVSLPDGLALVPLPPSLLDYSDLVPDGILLALKTFIPTPVLRVLRSQAQQPQLNKDEERLGEPTLLLLRKELVVSQTLLNERDRALDTVEKAMEMLSNEIQLWVKRCEEMVEVLREVEMERDNYKAGEGVAKALGKGVTVKLEEMDIGGGTTATLDLATELANIKTELADAKTELADTKTKLAHTETELSDLEAEVADTKAQLLNTSQDLERSEAALSRSAIQLAAKGVEWNRRSEDLVALNTELQRQIRLAESQASISSERDTALITMDGDRDSAREELERERDGSKKQLDGMKTRAADMEARYSALARESNDMAGRNAQFREFVTATLHGNGDADNGDTAGPPKLAQGSTSTRAEGERSASRLKLDSLWTSKTAHDNHQHVETCKRDPSVKPPCDELGAKQSRACSNLELIQDDHQTIIECWLELKESPTTPAELEAVEAAFERCDLARTAAIIDCLHITNILNFHRLVGG